jgi:hypothetical protein
LSYFHAASGAAMTRCSQPRVGLAGRRSPDDEALIAACAAIAPPNTALVAALSAVPVGVHILDARPRRNALANQAKGLGVESESVYAGTVISFLDVHNIHAMRESLRRVRDLCYPPAADAGWLAALDHTRWLRHGKAVLAAGKRAADLLRVGVPVVVHCSDGWDRTAQVLYRAPGVGFGGRWDWFCVIFLL